MIVDVNTGAIIDLTIGDKQHAASTSSPLAEIWYKTNDRREEMSMATNYSVQLPDPWGGFGLGVRNWPNESSANVSESRVWRPTLAAVWLKPSDASLSAGVMASVMLELRMPTIAADQYGCPRTVWLNIASVTTATGSDMLDITLIPVSKADEFCIKNEELCIENEEFCSWRSEGRGSRKLCGSASLPPFAVTHMRAGRWIRWARVLGSMTRV